MFDIYVPLIPTPQLYSSFVLTFLKHIATGEFNLNWDWRGNGTKGIETKEFKSSFFSELNEDATKDI